MASDDGGAGVSGPSNSKAGSFIHIFDRRNGNAPGKRISLKELQDTCSLRAKIVKEFGIQTDDKVVICTTNREEITSSSFIEDLVENGDTLYILNDLSQDLSAPVEERVEYLPHYDTLVKSGMYEYYASEGQNPLPFAFAELIDNSLAATANNKCQRFIEIKLLFDEGSNKNSVCVFDNGKGMTSKDLNDWAIYRLSKFNKRRRKGQNPLDSSIVEKEAMPRSLNSDISYFGVGGKQAIFFIGNSTRMITKSASGNDVHEICLSKEDFERKELQRESVYSGYIRNRRVGDASYVPKEDDHIAKLIEEEKNYESFTNVYISGIAPEHVKFLKSHFKMVCRQLSHIYHYYLHGPNGNVGGEQGAESDTKFRGINITVALFEKGKHPKRICLRDIKDDIHTQFLRSAASTFEFRAHVEGNGVVEGVIRYHPFLYDRETYPMLQQSDDSGAEDEERRDSRYPRGNRPMFECYWNGRLIPYTTVDVFDWCSPGKRPGLPYACFYRTSGALFTNDSFQVSTNKLTFTDLEMKLRDKNVLFVRVQLGQEQRLPLNRAYKDWLRACHTSLDKQIKFCGNLGTVEKKIDVNKSAHKWTAFKKIEWENRIFKAGNLGKTIRTFPCVVGTITMFLLKNVHEENELFATDGYVELLQEPASIWGEKRLFPLVNLDRGVTEAQVKELISEEESRLPSKLALEWPSGGVVKDNDCIPAGTPVGPIQVDIMNGRYESVSKIPGDKGKKLLVELTLTWHCNDGDQVLSRHTCQHGGKHWPYWFRRMENITSLGSYSLKLCAIQADVGSNIPAKFLPEVQISFTVIEGAAHHFTVDPIDSAVQVGVPFQLILNILDSYRNVVKPKKDAFVPQLSVSGGEISYGSIAVKGPALILKDVALLLALGGQTEKECQVKVVMPSLDPKSQSLKLKVVPGMPAKLEISPSEDELEIENGNSVKLTVSVVDCQGNVTAQRRQNVTCKFYGIQGSLTYVTDCSSNGMGILTGEEIDIKGLKNVLKMRAKIELQHFRTVKAVEKIIWVNPSSRPSQFEIFYQPAGSDLKEKMVAEQYIPCYAGESITGLAFRILDEGNRLMNIDSNIATKIKVNWAAKVPKETIKIGNLPDVRAPTTTDETKFCQISLVNKGGSIEFSFFLKPRPGKPNTLQCQCKHPKLRIGNALQDDITIKLLDAFGNRIDVGEIDLEDLHVICQGLEEKETRRMLLKNEGFVIKGVKFTDNQLDTKELHIKWKELECFQRLEVVAGPPEKMVLVGLDNQTPISLTNGQPFPLPIVVQLVDGNGFASKEISARVCLSRDNGLKLVPPPQQQKTSKDGQASFKGFSVAGKRGTYRITPKATIGSSTIEGPVIQICIEPDRTNPISMNVAFSEEDEKIVAGRKLPAITAQVLAEDGNPAVDVSAKDVVMKVWLCGSDQAGDGPPSKALTFYPSKKTRDDESGTFYFRDVGGPERAEDHYLVVHYVKSGKVILSSKQLQFKVNPSCPVKLVPTSTVNVPTVSNVKKDASRLLLKEVTMELQDEFGNPAGSGMTGTVDAVIISDSESDHPVFESGHDVVSLKLSNGSVYVDAIRIQANCAGIDGKEYLLKFLTTLDHDPALKVEPLVLPFLFYNDMRKQEEMALLSKERDRLLNSIHAYRSLLDATNQLIVEVQEVLKQSTEEERTTLDGLRKAQFYDIHNLTTPENIDLAIASLKEKKEKVQNLPRRLCQISVAPGSRGVVGKVCHLAQVEDDDAARVISWHMSSDMDCIITFTTEEAKRIFRETNGKQQVLPLDSVFKKSLPDWNKPLPHEKCRGFRPAGNPVYARSLLHFPQHENECRIVFGMLLGDTVVIDTLDDANEYRLQVVKTCYCPTILARTGERIRSNGKFGGSQNRALPIDRMYGAVFSAPISFELRQLSQQIELLAGLKHIMKKKKSAQEDLEHQLKNRQSEDMQAKHRECLETEAQLRELEGRLGLTPVHHDLPRSPNYFNFLESMSPKSSTSSGFRSVSSGRASSGKRRSAPPPDPRRAASLSNSSRVCTPEVKRRKAR